MGGANCAIVGCPAQKSKHKGLTFHKLPAKGTNDEWRMQLINSINRQDKSFNPDRATICSRHFKDSCFKTGPGGKLRRLIEGSLPTEYMPVRTIETPKPTERKPPMQREPPPEPQRVCYFTLKDLRKDSIRLPATCNLKRYCGPMASGNRMDMHNFKIELDVDDKPGCVWRTQDKCSGLPGDWTENSRNTAVPSSDTNPWNASAPVIKSEPDSPTDNGQGIKPEPVLHCVTSDRCHPLQSVDKREEKVGIKCEPCCCTCVDSSSWTVRSWSAVNSPSSEPGLWNNSSNSNLDSRTEFVHKNMNSDVIKTYALAANIGSEVIKTEAEADVDGPEADKQKKEPPWSMTEESPDQPSAVYSTVQPMSDSISGSPLSLNTSHQQCSATSVIFNSAELPGTSMRGETLHTVLPVSSTPDSGQKDGEKTNRCHVCDICNKDFTEMCKLKTHKVVHSGEKPFVCGVCSKAFTKPVALKRHQLIHTGQKPFVCDVCSKAFTDPGYLKKHKVIHTGQKPFVCDVCSKAFTAASYLKRHKLIHTGQKKYACDVCSKAFTEANTLKRHKLIHTGQKPFVCDFCSKAFTQASSLKAHKLIHTGQKPFVCDVCSKAFTNTRYLKKHKLIHTGHKSVAVLIGPLIVNWTMNNMN